MSHAKNTTAPSKAQHPALRQPFEARRGFTYYEVQVIYEDAGFKRTYPGVQDEALALELKGMIEPEVAPYPVRILWIAGQEDEVESFLRMESRATDMIKSVRSADRPGQEFMARLGLFGPYEGYAPQNAQSENVARKEEVAE
ncbi:hypothetical protein [Pseudomonas lactis]|uniref:hypothetical protein n=1 Tax=Pseudomonas lactis TaxID=1615674 RepID=UPI0019E69E5E|nr:hypothetical protein [Pseudomonas lactis]MBA6043782.1 hypothetical protein [Pseudomonas lactis]